MKAMLKLFEREVNPRLHVRRVAVVAKDVVRECDADPQLALFGPEVDTEKERRQQEAILSIRRKFGKNSILKGVAFEEGATARERNAQIGGHKA
jgi:DNA polymerase V